MVKLKRHMRATRWVDPDMVLWKTRVIFPVMTESLLDLLLLLSTAAHLEGKELFISEVDKECFTVRTTDWTANQANRLALKHHSVLIDGAFRFVRFFHADFD